MDQLDIEGRLLDVFRHSLGVSRLGPEDDLFACGANSILVSKAAIAAAEAGLAFPLMRVYECRTVRAVALSLGNGPGEGGGRPPAGEPALATAFPLTPTARFLMAEGRFDEHYNISSLLDLDEGKVDLACLSDAIRATMRAIPALGLRLERDSGGITQTYCTDIPDEPLELVDLRHLPADAFSQAVERAVARLHRAFVFEDSCPLIRFVFFRPHSGPGKLFILAQHLILDGLAYRLFLYDLDRAYRACAGGHPYSTIASADLPHVWQQRLSRYANEEAPAELPYWRGLPWPAYRDFGFGEAFRVRAGDRRPLLADATARALHHRWQQADWEDGEDGGDVLALQYDQCAIRRRLDPARTEAFFGLDLGLQFDAVLYAVGCVLKRLTGFPSLWIDIFDAVRGPVFPDCDVSRLAGYVNEIVPVPLDVPAKESLAGNVREVARQRRQVPRHGLGFRALRYLNETPGIAAEVAAWPDPRVVINYVATLHRDYPRRFLDLEVAREWPGPQIDESRTPYWVSFIVLYDGSRLAVDTRFNRDVIGYSGADRISRDVHAVLEEICDAVAGGGFAEE